YLDVETSGLLRDPEARVVEWALSVWNGTVEVFRGESLVSGEGMIPEAVSKINGITMEMTIGCPTFKELYGEWKDHLTKAILVAHNLSFDLGMINRDLIRQGEAPLGNPGIDSLALFRRMKPDLSSYKLTELVRVMGVLHENP
ncbi:DNA polymerase III, epsilon subunit, partial [mine drainage metagenome]